MRMMVYGLRISMDRGGRTGKVAGGVGRCIAECLKVGRRGEWKLTRDELHACDSAVRACGTNETEATRTHLGLWPEQWQTSRSISEVDEVDDVFQEG